jgi:hypothetical protein
MTRKTPAHDRQQAIRATIALESMALDWTHKKARVRACKGLMDALGVSRATGYRIIDDYFATKMETARKEFPTFWMFGQEVRQ